MKVRSDPMMNFNRAFVDETTYEMRIKIRKSHLIWIPEIQDKVSTFIVIQKYNKDLIFLYKRGGRLRFSTLKQ